MEPVEEMKMKRTLLLTVVLLLVIPMVACAESPATYKDRADFDRIFDEVARNFGAVEAAYYTYTMEYEKVPNSLEDMIYSGHLRVEWTNPYTGKPVKQTTTKEIGDIAWEVMDNGDYIGTTTYYVPWNYPDDTRWMRKDIWPYTQQELKKWVFADDVTREEQLVRVYCLQFEDALESYEIRFGSMPDSYEDLAKGDVNVAYINPITGKIVKNSPDLSPGDFWYEKIDEKHFAIVGWGLTAPVYFMSNDRTRDELKWGQGELGNADDLRV